MIGSNALKSISRSRLRDAQVLLRTKRFDGAVYLCGYAVEIALKARMCRSLRWSGFPETQQEFRGLQSIRTHDLEILLRLSGIEARIKAKYLAQWSVVLKWDPEKRYQATQTTEQHANDMIASAMKLLAVI